MTSKIEEEGRRMLRSSSRECAPERIVKAGKEIDVDLIMMGRTIKVLRLTSTPVVMFK